MTMNHTPWSYDVTKIQNGGAQVRTIFPFSPHSNRIDKNGIMTMRELSPWKYHVKKEAQFPLKRISWDDLSHSFHVTRFSDLVELWVIKIKMPMILCARSTLRSCELSTKRRSRGENTRKVCLFYSRIKHSRHIFKETVEVRTGLWVFCSLLCFSGADWLGRQTAITWSEYFNMTCRPEILH